MHNKPCKQHLTLLQPEERCPVCGWAAGDHPTHPSNREPRIFNEAANLRREVAELRAERERILGCVAFLLVKRPERNNGLGSPSVTIQRAEAEAFDGLVEMRLTGSDIVLTFKPKPKPPAAESSRG